MKNMKTILSIIILIILAPILIFSLVILFNSWTNPDDIPSFFGWKPFIVLSGSMETEIYPGDVAVVKEVDVNTIKVNDIIAFKDGSVVTTHRVININSENGVLLLKTKGDNNNVEDSGYVLVDQIEGKYVFKIRKLGHLIMFIQTPVGMIISLSIPLLLLLFIQILDSNKNKKYEKEFMLREKELKEKIAMLEGQTIKGEDDEKTL